MALAVFVSCYSACDSSDGNLITESTTRGCDTALGFTKSIGFWPSNFWSDKFWYRLDLQWQVDDAANAAFWDTLNQYWYGYGTDSWTISGNSDLVIDPAIAGS